MEKARQVDRNGAVSLGAGNDIATLSRLTNANLAGYDKNSITPGIDILDRQYAQAC